MPGYAIRVRTNGKHDFTATICWEYNNIFSAGEAVEEQYMYFGGESAKGQQLLKLCQQLCG